MLSKETLDEPDIVQLRQRVTSIFEAGESVYIDLASVIYINSSVLSAFVAMQKLSKEYCTAITFMNLQSRVRSIFEVTNMNQILSVETEDSRRADDMPSCHRRAFSQCG